MKDSIRFAVKYVAVAKRPFASGQEKKSFDDGVPAVNSKGLPEGITALRGLRRDCMTKADEFVQGGFVRQHCGTETGKDSLVRKTAESQKGQFIR